VGNVLDAGPGNVLSSFVVATPAKASTRPFAGRLSFRIFSGRFETESELNRVPFGITGIFTVGAGVSLSSRTGLRERGLFGKPLP